MSDSKTEGGSAPSMNVSRCEACGRAKAAPVPPHTEACPGFWPGGSDPECPSCKWPEPTGQCLRGVTGWDAYNEGSAECYRLGYERLRALMNEEPRRQAPPDALDQARAEGRAAALEETVGIVAHARRYYGEDIFSPDGTSPECGHAKWARNLLDGIVHEIRTAINQGRAAGAPESTQTPEIAAEEK